MAIEYQRVQFDFSARTGRLAEMRKLVEFDGRVRNPEAMLKGFRVEFVDGNGALADRNIGRLQVDLDAAINTTPTDTRRDRSVFVTGKVGLRDGSGTFDDAYRGSIECVVMADVGPH